MADLLNPYANPYLPSFVNQRPRIDNPTIPQTSAFNLGTAQSYSQIHSVKGFDGARAYSLANGASEILAEEDPNMARVYIVAKDANGQLFLQGFDLTPVEEPKPITMDDLSSTMNRILERLNKLEGDRNNDQSYNSTTWKGSKQPNNAGSQPNGRNGQGGSESSGNTQSGGGK